MKQIIPERRNLLQKIETRDKIRIPKHCLFVKMRGAGTYGLDMPIYELVSKLYAIIVVIVSVKSLFEIYALGIHVK